MPYCGERINAEAVLLAVVIAAEADAEHVVRFLRRAGIGGGAQMREIDPGRLTLGDAAAMRFDPAAVTRPDFL